MVSSITGPQSIESIWGQSGLVGAAKNAAASVAKPGASVSSALSTASNSVQGGGSVFQSFSADLQALLVQQQNVGNSGNSAKPAPTGNDPSAPSAMSQISQELGQSMQLFGGSAASASTMTNQVTQSALQSLQTLG